MLFTAILHVRPEGHREPRNEVESVSPTERLVGLLSDCDNNTLIH